MVQNHFITGLAENAGDMIENHETYHGFKYWIYNEKVCIFDIENIQASVNIHYKLP